MMMWRHRLRGHQVEEFRVAGIYLKGMRCSCGTEWLWLK